MKLFIELLFWLIGALVLYGVAVYVTMKVTGCKCETAARKVRCFISGQPENPISYNPNLVDEIHSIIRGVVGESRYNARMRLENRLPLVVFLTQGSLPTIQVAMDCVEDNEKSRLEALIVDAVKNQLHVKGLCTEVIANWDCAPRIMMPYLQIRYSVNADQEEELKAMIQDMVKKHLAKNQQVLDDSEEELYE